MGSLDSKVAVVAGASRGAGRGIAVALGDAGATVYCVGRTTRDGAAPVDGAPGTIEDTAAEVSRRGGVGIPVRTDCTVAAEVAELFERVDRDHGRVDVLANAVYGAADAIPTMEAWEAMAGKPFWETTIAQWPGFMDTGPYAYLLLSCYAARLMAKNGGGLIVGVTDGILDPVDDGVLEGRALTEYSGQLLWDLRHVTINRLMLNLAADAKAHGIAVMALMPGFMQTERVKMHTTTEEMKRQFRYDLSESPEYLGRAVAALAGDGEVMTKSGLIHFVADLAEEYGFTDVDGRRVPRFRPFD